MPTTKKTPTTARKTVKKTSTTKSSTMKSTPMKDMPMSESIKNSPTPTQKNRQNQMRMVIGIALLLVALYYLRGMFIVAFVNGQPITRYEVVRDLEKQAGQGATDALVSKKLIAMEADKKGIEIAQKEIDERISAIEKDLKSSGQTLDEVLEAQGVTRAEVEEQTKLQLMLKKLLKDKIAVKDAEVEAAATEQMSAKPEGMSDDEFKKQIRSSLEDQQFSFEAQSYIQELQNNAKVTYWHQY